MVKTVTTVRCLTCDDGVDALVEQRHRRRAVGHTTTTTTTTVIVVTLVAVR